MTQSNGKFVYSEYDFDVPIKVRQYRSGRSDWDGYASAYNKGRNRKTSNRQLSFTGYSQKNGKQFKTVAIGKNKFTKKIVVVFDNSDLPGAINIRNYENKMSMVQSANHVYRFFDLLGLEVPVAAGTSIKVIFNLLPEPGETNVFSIVPLTLSKIDSNGNETVKTFKKQEATRLEQEHDFA
jgi:hypothetical protein